MALTRREILGLLAGAPIVRSVRLPPSPKASADHRSLGEGGQPDRLKIGLFSRHLQWTGVEDAIDVAHRIGFDGIEWTVRPGAHINPDRVETELPKAVELTRKAGMVVSMIATDILDAQSPYAEPILRTAQGLGIKYYRSAMFRYDYDGDLERQIEALKPRIATLVALNQKYGMTIGYHTHSGRGNIGGNVWDLWMAIRQFDPGVIALNYDTGHTTARNGTGWIDAAKVALEYIRCLAIKDVLWTRRSDGMWAQEFCPIGAGLVDFKGVFTLLKGAGFNGPINLHVEHDNLLGTNVGTWKLDMPRQRFMTIVKYDLDQVRRVMTDARFV